MCWKILYRNTCAYIAYRKLHILSKYWTSYIHTHTHVRVYSCVKHLLHLKCSRLVLTKLTSPSTASNKESILLTLQLLAFTFSFNTPFQLWWSICRSPQRPELWNWSALQCSQKTNKKMKKTQINRTKHSKWLPVIQFISMIYWMVTCTVSQARKMPLAAAMLTAWETAVLYVCTELPHMQQSWHFWKVLTYSTGMTWLGIMCYKSLLRSSCPT